MWTHADIDREHSLLPLLGRRCACGVPSTVRALTGPRSLPPQSKLKPGEKRKYVNLVRWFDFVQNVTNAQEFFGRVRKSRPWRCRTGSRLVSALTRLPLPQGRRGRRQERVCAAAPAAGGTLDACPSCLRPGFPPAAHSLHFSHGSAPCPAAACQGRPRRGEGQGERQGRGQAGRRRQGRRQGRRRRQGREEGEGRREAPGRGRRRARSSRRRRASEGKGGEEGEEGRGQGRGQGEGGRSGQGRRGREQGGADRPPPRSHSSPLPQLARALLPAAPLGPIGSTHHVPLAVSARVRQEITVQALDIRKGTIVKVRARRPPLGQPLASPPPGGHFLSPHPPPAPYPRTPTEQVWPHPGADALWVEEIDLGEEKPRQARPRRRPAAGETREDCSWAVFARAPPD